jgi:hypothetical protein
VLGHELIKRRILYVREKIILISTKAKHLPQNAMSPKNVARAGHNHSHFERLECTVPYETEEADTALKKREVQERTRK